MRRIICSRHAGAVNFARSELERAGLGNDWEVVAHLDDSTLAQLGEGDILVGVLPTNLIARLKQAGVRVILITLNLPPEARGKELSVEQMRSYGGKLEEVVACELRPLEGVV